MVNDDDETRRLQARVEELEQLVAQILMAPPPSPEPAPAPAAGGDDIDFVYPNVEAWVTEEFAPIHVKPIGGDFRWCPKWWEHIEAVSRFEALWRAWERLRLDPAFGMATWYRDFLDISLNGITGPRGPFARCSPERHEPLKPLPLEPAPAGYWDWPGDTDAAAATDDALAAYWAAQPYGSGTDINQPWGAPAPTQNDGQEGYGSRDDGFAARAPFAPGQLQADPAEPFPSRPQEHAWPAFGEADSATDDDAWPGERNSWT